MATRGKKFRTAVAKVDRTREYPIAEAVALVKDSSFAKFDETVDVAVNGAEFDSKRNEWRARFRAALTTRAKEPDRGND